MHRFWTRLAAGIVVLTLGLGAVALWKKEELSRLLAVNRLFDADRIVWNFSHMDALFETVTVPRDGADVISLSLGPPLDPPDGFRDWLDRRAVTGLVVLSDGERVLEDYRLGTDADDLRISWSVAKSFLSALVGVIVEDGDIPDLDAPVTEYVPGLAGSAYDGVTIRQVMQMTSGVEFDEDYLDFWSDINRMGRVLALGRSMDGFAAGLEDRVRAPGEAWEYVSIDTHVLAMVVRGATGRALPTLMSERIMTPLGVERDPYYITDGYGTAFALGGLNMTTRDYARMGQMVANGGTLGGRRIVPAEWIAESTTPSAPTAPGAIGYGYQWWIPADARPGEVLARGIYGQYVYIDSAANVVVAINAADRRFREDGAFEDALQMMRALRDAAETGE
ncbi:CubicO group peptidase, beta-lactamase class C family [Roseivivax marinus]|uniref:serine hydrolase domain-containing protein n=1 Tax=Roseivivax marinus TaxID=1379903 RepID=UPI0008B783D6|nr:serine hydrolase [Roseivivax marinus]SEK93417.1 CubicO group peptidase, beta-lactamase class C family [Roseivivax marinus]